MSKFKSLFSWSLYFFVFVIGVAVCFEVGLRLHVRYIKKDLFKISMMNHVQKRIDDIWDQKRENRKIFWGPPYVIYWNEGLDDEERMLEIFKYSNLPKSGSWLTPNFLRDIAEIDDHKFDVRTNSLGFRDVERTIEKPENTIRIIVLGSYPAFGHGVSNNETYSFQLQKKLQESHPGKKIEIWNGGQQGSVAIMGFSRFKYELHKYQPDLILFDYGWVDLFMRKDQTKAASDISIWKREWSALQKFGYKLRFEWLPRFLTSKVIDNQVKKSFWDLNIRQWENVMSNMSELASSRNIPVLYLRHHRETVWPTLYEKFHKPEKGLYFFDTSPSFDQAQVSEEVINDFWSRSNWLTEMKMTKEDVKKEAKIYYKIDTLQFNKFGHKAIADILYPQVKKILKL